LSIAASGVFDMGGNNQTVGSLSVTVATSASCVG
jgi:hypothetical protein